MSHCSVSRCLYVLVVSNMNSNGILIEKLIMDDEASLTSNNQGPYSENMVLLSFSNEIVD